MHPAENSSVLLFLSVIAIVYVLAGGIVVRLVIARLRHTKRFPGPLRIWSERMVLALAVAGVVCVAYGYLVEPYWPAVTHVRLTTARLAPDSRSIRIVQISDLHCDPRVRLEERLPDIVSAEKPDLIVFTGDALNSAGALPVFQRCMRGLAAIAPTLAVKGNWDTGFWRGIDLFGNTGVEELDGTAREVRIGESSIWIGGIAVGNEGRFAQSLESIPHGEFTLFLYHYPDLIHEVAHRRVDLYCAGHTHGGQVALPFYGALITLSKFGKTYESGLYRVNETWMYVNRGIGMEGGPAPRVRFWARPEVTVFDIVPEAR